jgi:hypothetical protein
MILSVTIHQFEKYNLFNSILLRGGISGILGIVIQVCIYGFELVFIQEWACALSNKKK